jgi:hypothetical protein
MELKSAENVKGRCEAGLGNKVTSSIFDMLVWNYPCEKVR